jgi:hypothetical protein
MEGFLIIWFCLGLFASIMYLTISVLEFGIEKDDFFYACLMLLFGPIFLGVLLNHHLKRKFEKK